jgi:bacterioferritin (cytochrome b1)
MTVASQVKQTLASLKGVQGTLRIYSTQTQDGETVAIFKEALETTEAVINDLEQRVQVLEFQEPQYKGN